MSRLASSLGRTLLRLSPDNFTDNMWGGDWIPRLKKIKARPAGPVGESWEFSLHRDRPSHVLVERQKLSLSDLVEKDPAAILGGRVVDRWRGAAPFLVKLIDSRDDLSVQVHPPDDYAARVENDFGKAECWIVLETGTARGEGFIYVGFDPKKAAAYPDAAGFEEAFFSTLNQANSQGPSEEARVRARAERLVLPFLNKMRVRAGDVINLPPGTIHAIGRGVRLFEIQQTSDLTYRVWDWNRPDAKKLREGKLEFRPLRVDRAKAVLDFRPREADAFHPPERRLSPVGKGALEETVVVEHAGGFFAASRIVLKRRSAAIDHATNGAFQTFTVISGAVDAWVHSSPRFRRWGRVSAGHTILMPAALPAARFVSASGRAEIIRSFVP